MKLEWSRYTDGVARIELRAVFTLSLEEMAGALAYHERTFSWPARPLNRKRAVALIREALYRHGGQCLGQVEPRVHHYDAVRLAFGPPPGEADAPTPVTT